jgi:hypothetical protein
MSVLACDRRGCEHIMCNRLILDHSQYICGDCWDELRELKLTWPDRMSARDVRDAIESFMNSGAGAHKMLDQDGIDEEFEKLTRKNYVY